MPELPEVETIRRTLQRVLPGQEITGVRVCLPRLIKEPEAAEFARQLVGKKIERLGRRGKYLLLFLSDAYILVVHLRMTGRLFYTGPEAPLAKHTHLIFSLGDGHELRYQDVRQFGTFYLLPESELGRLKGLAGLGPEPLEKGFDSLILEERLKKRHGKLKAALLDQGVLAGLGNIYVDEALFAAGLGPAREASSLNREEVERLYRAIRQVLLQGVRHRGTTVRDYVDGSGAPGGHQSHLNVYKKEGEPCLRCGGTIVRQKLAGRSSFFCPRCQQ